MNAVTIYIPDMPSVSQALQQRRITTAAMPCADVTHLLLPVPLFDTETLPALLQSLPRAVTVVGGRLTHPLLDGYNKIDLLQNEEYLAKNAALTAEGALRLAGTHLPLRFSDITVLVIGWGRIGKCLAQQLSHVGARVCVAARKEHDRAMIGSLGYEALTMEQMKGALYRFRLIFNTVPAPLLSAEDCMPACVKIDLASVRGIAGDDVIHARGIPGKMLPEAQAVLIADTVAALLRKEDAQ